MAVVSTGIFSSSSEIFCADSVSASASTTLETRVFSPSAASDSGDVGSSAATRVPSGAIPHALDDRGVLKVR